MEMKLEVLAIPVSDVDRAKKFYEKLGFTAFGTLPDYPPGHATTYYMKRLET